MPPLATPACAGMVEGLAVVKRRRSKGFIAKSLSIEIVCVVFVLFSDNRRAFCKSASTRRLPHHGPPHVRGPVPCGPHHGPPCARARAVRVWVALGRNQFSFFVENKNSSSFVFLS